jgi:hypothetical protein
LIIFAVFSREKFARNPVQLELEEQAKLGLSEQRRTGLSQNAFNTGGACSLLRTRLQVDFPVNRENNREYLVFDRFAQPL